MGSDVEDFIALAQAFLQPRPLGQVDAELGLAKWRDRLSSFEAEARSGEQFLGLEGLVSNLYEFDVPLSTHEYAELMRLARRWDAAEAQVAALLPLVLAAPS